MILVWLRLIVLSLVLVRRGIGKFVMVVLLVSVCVLTFLTVESFATASANDLNSSVSNTLGATGEYRVGLGPPLTITTQRADQLVLPTLRRFTQRPISLVDVLGAADLNCRRDENVGSQPLYVLRDESGHPTAVSDPQARPWTVCLAGQDISRLARGIPADQQRVLGTGMLLPASLEPAAQAATGTAVARSYVLVTGSEADEAQQIQDAVVHSVSQLGRLSGLSATEVRGAVSVERVDAGELVRRAVSGVQLVYGLVAWAVLAIGGVGILIMEMANVRERNWLFGLARAMGARRGDVAFLVALDAILVVTASAFLVGIVLIGAAPALRNFGETTFQVPLDLVSTRAVSDLVAGILALLMIGATWPARRAAQLDPVDILERR